MSSVEASKRQGSSTGSAGVAEDPDLPPVLSQRRPARRERAAEQPEEDRVHDTIPAPMWFVEE